MKRQQRRNHDPEFKTKVVIEALRETCTFAELGAKYEVHPNQIRTWKNEFLQNATRAFDGDKLDKSEIKILEEKQDQLHKLIGEKEMEIDFLKKNLKKLNLL